MSPQERKELIEELMTVLKEVPITSHHLTPEEAQWVRLAIEAQAERKALRQAIIEKSLAGFVWFCICGVGYVFVDFLKTHGLRF